MDDTRVHIFWDHSNLFHSAQDACDDRRDGTGLEPGHRYDARLHFQHIYEFAAAGRVVERAVAVGSIPPGLTALWDRLRDAGVSIDLFERGADSGKEQAVDQALQLEMLRSLADHQPCVAVVLSGDGGFAGDIERLLDKGWGVEALAFGASMSHKLRRIAVGHNGRGKYVDLDPWYRQLVYLQGLQEEILRPADPLDLTGRPRA
jgi:hypothetical protein